MVLPVVLLAVLAAPVPLPEQPIHPVLVGAEAELVLLLAVLAGPVDSHLEAEEVVELVQLEVREESAAPVALLSSRISNETPGEPV